jgi:TRAP-type C4-dicarboxylate transport system substrate-binding protein
MMADNRPRAPGKTSKGKTMQSMTPSFLTKSVSALAGAMFAVVGMQGAASAADKTWTLKYQHSYPPTLAFYNKTGANFMKYVEEKSDGRIKFEVYDVGAIASVAGMLEATHIGILDMHQSWGGFYVGDVPEADVETGLPLAWDEAYEVYDAYYQRGLAEVIDEAYGSRFNVKHFPAIISMQYGLATTESISSLEDLKGKKIRAIGAYGDFVQLLGASAVVVPGAELYTALQLGTVDGLVYGAEAMVAQGLETFLKSMIVKPNFNAGAGQWLLNKDIWNELPDDLKQVFHDAAKMQNMETAMQYRTSEQLKVGVMAKAGVNMMAMPAGDAQKMREMAHQIWDKVAARGPLAAKAVEIVKQQQREFGRM